MKRILIVAALAISTLFASAPAKAMDVGTAVAIQAISGMAKGLLHVGQHRRPCRVVIDGRCVQPRVVHRGYYPATYLPPDIPGSRGYTGRYDAHVQGAAPYENRTEHKLTSSKHRCVYKGPNAAPLDAQGFNAWCG